MYLYLLSDKLKYWRKERALSQTALSEITDIPQQTISDIESGKIISPSYKNVQKLAKGLKIPVSDLVEPDEE